MNKTPIVLATLALAASPAIAQGTAITLKEPLNYVTFVGA